MNPNTEEFIPFSRPVLGTEEEAAVLEVLRSGWLTTGPQAKAFEVEFGAYVGVGHALAVNSATAGLHLALEALGVGPGDLCAVPSYTFTATAEVIRYLGADPVFVDSGSKSPNLDLDALERVCQSRQIKVVLPVHLTGEPVDWPRLRELQSRYHFRIVEDAAHVFPAFGSEGFYGTLGDIGVYSFYANKNMTTGEGGMIVTNDTDLARRMSVMRLHGIDRDAFDRFTSKKASWEYAVVAPGFKYNMTDVAAAIGRAQLKKAQGFWDERRRVVQRYQARLAGFEGLVVPDWRPDHAWHVFSVLLPAAFDRNAFVDALTAKGVGVSVHYIPLHRMPYWQERYALRASDFPRAEERYHRTFSLPLFPSLTDHQVDLVIERFSRVWETF